MIDVKVFKKPKRNGDGVSTAGGSSSYYQSSTDKVAYSERSGVADYATEAGRATYAETASSANYATRAGIADELAEGSVMYDLFLRKDIDDTAHGLITLEQGFDADERANFGDFFPGLFGTGAQIDKHGHAELDSLDIRGTLRAAEFVFNKVSAEEGDAIRSIGRGTIDTVTIESSTQGTATLRMQGDELPTIDVGDICRGMYNTVFGPAQQLFDGDDINGFRTKKGFFTSYFYIVSIEPETITDGEDTIYTFHYALQNAATPHPCANMKFAVYGNFDDTKPERQSCMYITSIGMAPRLLMLAGVNDWAFTKYNIKIALGYIEGLVVRAVDENGDGYDKILEGDAGIYVEDNIYFGGILNQFTTEDFDYLKWKLGSNYTVQLTRGSDNIVVDAVGNVIGGLVKTENGNTIYRLQTGVTIYDSYHDCYMTVNGIAGDEDIETISDTEFVMYAIATGCQIEIDGADVRVVSIDNVTSASTDAELATMRNTQECSVKIIVRTNSGWTTQLTYPIKITHLDEAYITFDLENEVDMMSYRSQNSRYDGIPIATRIRAYKDGAAKALTSVTATDDDGVAHTVTTANPSLTWPWTFDDNGTTVSTGLQWTLNIDGTLTLSHINNNDAAEVDLPDDKHTIRLACTTKYAGVTYTSPTKVFTLQETTDTSICRLMLSAGAVVKTGNAFVPDTVAVQVSVTSATGKQIFSTTTDAALAEVGLKVRYLDGTYTPGANWAVPVGAVAAMPPFASLQSNAMTVLLVNAATNTVVDVESIPISAVGRDGAGQPYVVTNVDSYPVDCDENGNIVNDDTLSLDMRLKWGDEVCVLTDATVQYNGTTHQCLTPGATNQTIAYADLDFDSIDSHGDPVHLDSGYAVVSLTGTDTNGDTHTATKTVAILANRQGSKGNPGNPGSPGSDGVAVVFDLDNEMDGMSYNSMTGRYTGLPITTHYRVRAGAVAQDLERMGVMFTDGETTRILEAEQNHDTDSAVWVATNLLVTIDRTTGELTIDHRGAAFTENDIADGRTAFIIQGSTTVHGTSYSNDRVFTLREQTDSVIYRLLLSASAISKDSNTYTPATVTVTVSVTTEQGTEVLDLDHLPANIAVWYLDGAYDPTDTWATIQQAQSNPPAMPAFADVQSGCVTVLLVNTATQEVLDVESLTINAVGRDGAGQPYIYSNLDQIVIDCNADGIITADTQQIRINARLRFGEYNCELTEGEFWTGDTLETEGYLVAPREVSRVWTFTKGQQLNSTKITIKLTGTDSNGDTHTATKTIPIIANRRGITGSTGASLRFRGVWNGNTTYVWNDQFRDAVKYGTEYYIVNVYNATSPLGTPGTDETKWMSLGGQEFLATGLLLAESAVIELLSSNIIHMRDENGILTASINEDQHGAYCIYYPSGKKMMEFSSDGFIYYYNDNDNNTVAWKLGHGGSIMTGSTDDWVPVYLAYLGSTMPPSANLGDKYDRDLCYKFKSGSGGNWAEFDNHYYSSNSPANPAQHLDYLAGWYTPDTEPHQSIQSMDDTRRAITLYHFSTDSNGRGGYLDTVMELIED